MSSPKLSKNTLYVHLPQHLIFLAGIYLIVVGKVSAYWLFGTYLCWVIIGYFGFSVFYHRYFAHKAFKMNRFWEIVWGYLGLLVGRGSPINLASLHCAEHHAYADTEKDPHSPARGMLWSWLLWSETHVFRVSPAASKHLIKDPYIRFLDRRYLRIFWFTAVVIAILNWRFAVYGLIGAGVLHFHVEGAVSTFCHLNNFGKKDFPLPDNSRNIRGLFNVIFLGTGLHNNHHAFPKNYHYAVLPGDFDLAKYVVPIFINKNDKV